MQTHPSANSRLHHLVPSSAGDRSLVPSAVAAGAMGFHALHAEELNSVFLGRGTGGLGAVSRASSTDSRESSPTGRARRAREAG